MNKEIKHYKVKQLPSRPLADSVYWVKASPSSEVSGYITDLQGVPYPLKDISGSGGIQTITNNDGNISVVGSNNITINISPALLSVINSALQSGDNISELTNDAGYLKLEKVVTQEIPIGIIDGTNNTFSTLTPLVTSTEKIFVNGQRQIKPEDYNISGQTINFTFSPQINETILIDYIKQ